MPRPPLFGIGLVGKSRAVTSKRLQNVYLEFRPVGEKVQVCAFGTAGLDLFGATFGDTPHRGQPLNFEPGSVLYTCHRGMFYEVNNAGVRTARGTLLTSTGTTYMAHNGAQVMIVDGTYGYIYSATAVAQIISSISLSGTTATITTAAAHGFGIGMQVTISGASPAEFNGTFTITASTPTSFSYTTTAHAPVSISTITRVTTLATLTTSAPHTLTTGSTVVVSGATPSQYNGTYLITVTGANTFTYVMASDPGSSASPVGSYSLTTVLASPAGSYVITSAFAQIVAPGFPINPKTVTFQDGYFVVNQGGTGNYQISGLYDGLTWDPLDVGTAESNPDPIVRIFADHGQLIPAGDISLEFHSDTGAVDFPYARIQGANIEWGLAAINSMVKFDNSVAFLAANKMGQFQVVRLNGFTPQRISNSDVENQINGYAVASDATAYSYLQDGHPMYQLNFPSAGYSWLFDGSTGEWSSLKSAGITRHIAEYGVNFLGKTVVTDYANGNLYKLNPLTYTDNGAVIERQIIGEHWDDPELARTPIDKIRLDLEGGVGLTSGQGINPQISMQCSKDRGQTWGVERWKPIGPIGAYATKVEWSRWGRSRNWTFFLKMTDPVKFAVLGAILNPID